MYYDKFMSLGFQYDKRNYISDLKFYVHRKFTTNNHTSTLLNCIFTVVAHTEPEGQHQSLQLDTILCKFHYLPPSESIYSYITYFWMLHMHLLCFLKRNFPKCRLTKIIHAFHSFHRSHMNNPQYPPRFYCPNNISVTWRESYELQNIL
jgi:hypothetical protein